MYQSQSAKSVYPVSKKRLLIKMILKTLGKKIFTGTPDERNIRMVIPSNCETFVTDMSEQIKKKFPQLHVLLLTANTLRVGVSEWINYDVVLYSPVVSAGSSFNPVHFDVEYCYFSCQVGTAGNGLQQIFRVRNLTLNHIYIHVKQIRCKSYIPYKDSRNVALVMRYIINKSIALQKHPWLEDWRLKDADALLQRDYTTGMISNDSYLNLYAHYIYKRNKSAQNYQMELMSMLNMHGVKFGAFISEEKSDESQDELKDIDMEFKSISKARKESEIIEIVTAPDITFEQFNNKDPHSQPSRPCLDKYRLKYHVKLRDISVLSVKTYLPLIYVKYNLDKFLHLYGTNTITSELDEKTTAIIHSYWNKGHISIDQILQKSNHQAGWRLWHCINLLRKAGFLHMFDTNRLQINVEALDEYITQNNKEICYAFDCNPFRTEISSPMYIKELTKWINNRLYPVFGIKIHKTSRHVGADYKIDGLDLWTLDRGELRATI